MQWVRPSRPFRSAMSRWQRRTTSSAWASRSLHTDGHFSVVQRDDARIHLWESADTSWRGRGDLAAKPVVSGAESFLAGTASCRSRSTGIEELYAEMDAAGVLHGVSGAGPQDTDYGAREFHVGNLDGNLLTFYLWL